MENTVDPTNSLNVASNSVFVPTYSLEELKKLRSLKKFPIYNHAKSVHLLENNIVKKIYPKSSINVRYFNKEIKMMNHLKDCPNVAKLLNYEEATLTLYMTYCGKTPSRSKTNLKKIKKGAKELHKKWGVYRFNRGKVVYDIYVPNTGIKNGLIHFFDLAGDKWHIAETQEESYQHMRKQMKKKGKVTFKSAKNRKKTKIKPKRK